MLLKIWFICWKFYYAWNWIWLLRRNKIFYKLCVFEWFLCITCKFLSMLLLKFWGKLIKKYQPHFSALISILQTWHIKPFLIAFILIFNCILIIFYYFSQYRAVLRFNIWVQWSSRMDHWYMTQVHGHSGILQIVVQSNPMDR